MHPGNEWSSAAEKIEEKETACRYRERDAPVYVYSKTEKERRGLEREIGRRDVDVGDGRRRRESLGGAKTGAFSGFH